MGKRRPERDFVEKALMENAGRKAHDIAKEAGLMETMGYDKAVSYVRNVKKALRERGQLNAVTFASDEDRLHDIQILFELRQGKMSSKAAYFMLLLNCYYRFRSVDDDIHMRAIDDTYEKNRQLENPFAMIDAIKICDVALAQYMASIDEEQNAAAIKKGYPGAGLNYKNETFMDKLEITSDEIQNLRSIQTEME